MELGSGLPPEAVTGLRLPAFAGEKDLGEREPQWEEHGVPAIHRPGKHDRERVRPSEEAPPFVLSEALPVVPGKLVKKIQSGDYVEMAELLKDNVEAERRRVAAGDSGQTGRTCRREVPDFDSWLQCFSLYAAVVCAKYPQKARELWAYQALMLAEYRKCGGRGWHLYDSAFRQQITNLETVDFSKVNQGLYATTFLAYGGKGQFCGRCMASDHSQEDCALNPRREVPVVQLQEQRSAGSRREEPQGDTRRRRGRRGACYAFNDGRCSLPYCRFEHVCSVCGGEHRKPACRARGMERQRAPDRSTQIPANREVLGAIHRGQ